MIKKDYIISSQVDCDPYAENCFIWECDPDSDVEGEACTGDPEMDIWYYKIADRVAANIPLCDPNEDETCLPFECDIDEADCGETLCDDVTKEEQGAECSGDPEEFLLNNPIEEEEAACEEGDEECEMPEEEAICEEGDEECEAAAEEETTCEEGDEECLNAQDEEGTEEMEGEETEATEETSVEEVPQEAELGVE